MNEEEEANKQEIFEGMKSTYQAYGLPQDEEDFQADKDIGIPKVMSDSGTEEDFDTRAKKLNEQFDRENELVP
jgi:hypothetical protein